jgi:hypothetical protein
MVEWFEALDDWDENVALTRSRDLIDGSLSLDIAGDGGEWQPAKRRHLPPVVDQELGYDANSSSNALASFRSRVSWPSVNQP